MPTLVSSPAKSAVAGAGAVGYESGSHADIGKIAALTTKTSRSVSSTSSLTCWGSIEKRSASCASDTVPVAP